MFFSHFTHLSSPSISVFMVTKYFHSYVEIPTNNIARLVFSENIELC